MVSNDRVYCNHVNCVMINQLMTEDHVQFHINSGFPVYDTRNKSDIAGYHTGVDNSVEPSIGSEGKNSYRVPIPYRFDLIPPIVLQQLAEVYEEGSRKYGDAKYIEKPLPHSVIVNHMYNHLLQWCSGDRSELHLAKVMWGAASLITLEQMTLDSHLPSQSDMTAYGSHVQEALQKRLENEQR